MGVVPLQKKKQKKNKPKNRSSFTICHVRTLIRQPSMNQEVSCHQTSNLWVP